MADAPYHWTGFEVRDGGVVATCNCGWRSDPAPDAASAGRAADQHRAGRADHDGPTR